MIYLIGGPSRSGKTILAQKLSNTISASIIPLDFLEAAVTEYYPSEKSKDMRPFSVMRNKTNKDNKKLIQQFSAEDIVRAYDRQGMSTWDGIKAVINYGVHLNDSIIIEGYQITPKFVSDILKNFTDENIRAIFLVKENESAILKGWEHAPSNDWLLQNSDESVLKGFAQVTAKHGKFFASEAKKYNLKYVNTDENFDKRIKQALDYLSTT